MPQMLVTDAVIVGDTKNLVPKACSWHFLSFESGKIVAKCDKISQHEDMNTIRDASGLQISKEKISQTFKIISRQNKTRNVCSFTNHRSSTFTENGHARSIFEIPRSQKAHKEEVFQQAILVVLCVVIEIQSSRRGDAKWIDDVDQWGGRWWRLTAWSSKVAITRTRTGADRFRLCIRQRQSDAFCKWGIIACLGRLGPRVQQTWA